MDIGTAGLQEQPFRSHGGPLLFVRYAGQYNALKFLNSTYENINGLGLFMGPSLSGKSTILQRFVDDMDPDVAVAIVDGEGLNTTELLGAILGQFGYCLDCNSVNELINMLKVFTVQQAASGLPPLLFIENTQLMNPSALRVLCELASFKVRHASALRIVLTSDRPIQSIIKAPAMAGIASRLTGEYFLEPLARSEMADYLYAKLEAGGSDDPSHIMPRAVCHELHRASGGWPGIVDRLALLALAKADCCPVRKTHIEHPDIPEHTGAVKHLESIKATNIEAGATDGLPRIYVSLNGKTIDELVLDRPRAIIGRSEHNDLAIESRFISRHHAMFVRHGSTTFMTDLNSTNGTFVNSRQISNHVMMHDDVISLGNYSLKFDYPAATHGSQEGTDDLADTIIMKNLGDIRRMFAHENTQAMSADIDAQMAMGDTDG